MIIEIYGEKWMCRKWKWGCGKWRKAHSHNLFECALYWHFISTQEGCIYSVNKTPNTSANAPLLWRAKQTHIFSRNAPILWRCEMSTRWKQTDYKSTHTRTQSHTHKNTICTRARTCMKIVFMRTKTNRYHVWVKLTYLTFKCAHVNWLHHCEPYCVCLSTFRLKNVKRENVEK